MSDGQMLTFTLFVVFYIPCVATIAVIARELGWRDTAWITGFSVLLATAVGVAGRLGYALFS
jgi:ferrous iron transport protein B